MPAMAGRTFAVGDIHGDIEALRGTLGLLPTLDAGDTVVFLGDYVDRGPSSRQVVEFVRVEFPRSTPAKVVALRGNHEDGWLRVKNGGWPEFIIPINNGCLATLRSYEDALHFEGDVPSVREIKRMQDAGFFPPETLAWFSALPHYYEDDHAIYVHAGLTEREPGRFAHPSELENKTPLLWVRTLKFFTEYRGKQVVCGHTTTEHLPPELSSWTPDDPLDMWVGERVKVIDTGCGKGGFLTILELPAGVVYESRSLPGHAPAAKPAATP